MDNRVNPRLARRMRKSILTLLQTHRKASSLYDSNTQELVFTHAGKHVIVTEQLDRFEVLTYFRGGCTGDAWVTKHNRDPEINFRNVPKGGGLDEEALDALLNVLGGYPLLVGLNHPYGYVSGDTIVAIFARWTTHPKGHLYHMYVQDGSRRPNLDLFDQSLSAEVWCRRFWQLVDVGNVVPLREGKELAAWSMGNPPSSRLDTSELSSKMYQLGSRYDSAGEMIVGW